jgi:hypothetical protein
MMGQFMIRDDAVPADDPLSSRAIWLPDGDL